MFEFFGFGQSGAGPSNIAANAEVNQEINDNDNGIGPNDQPMAEGWGLWPNQQDQQAVNNLVQVPIQQGEAFLEMNDLIQAPEINLDLNEPLDDDLGGIEDLLHAAENLDEQPPFKPQPEDIIIEDINSDAESDDQAIPVNEPVNVEVFIPLEPINPEEIHPDELMDEADFDEEQQVNLPENEAQNQQHLNVGFVEFIEPAGDPVFQQYLNRALPLFLPNAEAVRIWANFFSSSGGTNSVTIPHHWADFFHSSPLKPH